MMTELRKRRLAKGITMCKLAAQANVSYSGVSRYENNYATPSKKTAEKLAHALDTTVEALYPGTVLKDLIGG